MLDFGLQASAMFASLTDGSARFAQFTSTDGSYTPVIAATSGTLAYKCHDSQTDSVGNHFDIFGWSANYNNSPITDAWGYQNGVLIASFHADWHAVSGGYTLADQTLGSFYQDGTLEATIVCTVSGGGGGSCGCSCVTLMKNDESFGDRISAPIFAALDKVGCWLGPKVAYASVQCLRQGLMFGAETYGMAVATWYGGPFASRALVAAAWWLGPTWTNAMYDWLDCLNSSGQRIPRGTNACVTNSFLCK